MVKQNVIVWWFGHELLNLPSLIFCYCYSVGILDVENIILKLKQQHVYIWIMKALKNTTSSYDTCKHTDRQTDRQTRTRTRTHTHIPPLLVMLTFTVAAPPLFI